MLKMVRQMTIDNEYFIYKRLDWDSRNLGLETYELQLKQDLNAVSINEIKSIWNNANLLYIKNNTKNRINSKFIGEETSAVIYDTNISFVLDLKDSMEFEVKDYSDFTYAIESEINVELNEFINFNDSRFIKDVQLNNRMGVNIYSEWIMNSFNLEKKKFFTIRKKNIVLGFILYQIHDDSMSIELISVKTGFYNQNIGSHLIENFKKIASDSQLHYIYVGTQISNIVAINFYIKNKFKVKDTTDIYHWWK
jgi:dTDP-4-amino-4,6-dideoxy-D-galactose acyltransferase